MIKYILCKLGFHKRYIDEMGCILFEACENCNWTGRQKDYMEEVFHGDASKTKDLLGEINIEFTYKFQECKMLEVGRKDWR
jgi:hypothetical protein